MDLNYWMDRVVNTEGVNRVELARKNLLVVLEEAEKILEIEKENHGLFTWSLVKLFVRADRVVTFEDYSFVTEVLNRPMSFEEFKKAMADNGDDDEREDFIDMAIDALSKNGKEAACIFGMCIMQSNDSLSSDEMKLFTRILK